MTRPVYLAAGRRTPFGKERGVFRAVEAWQLGSAALRAVLATVPPAAVDRVVLANVTNGGNVARLAALDAGLAPACPALTVNGQCAGGLTAVRLGVEAIRAGAAGVVLAGGAESVSHTLVDLGPQRVRTRDSGDRRPRVAHAPPPYGDPDMGEAADTLARELGITREEQDALALESRRRAAAADERLRPAMAAVTAGDREVAVDELRRRTVTAALLARIPPAFAREGTVTAGNAAALADGAAVVALASGEALERCGLTPLARVVATAGVAGDPACPPPTAIAAAERVLAAAGIAAAAVDRWEVNEAFAAKVIAFRRHFGLDGANVNADGGALAFGHPYAASGGALLVQLLDGLRNAGGRLGVAAIAGAGGLGEAAAIELVE